MKKIMVTAALLCVSSAFAGTTYRPSEINKPPTESNTDRMSTSANPNTAATAEKQQKTLRVVDLTCTGCDVRVQNAVRKVPGVSAVIADPASGEVTITVESGKRVDDSAVARAVEAEGFKVVR